jgi:hypothetical protein
MRLNQQKITVRKFSSNDVIALGSEVRAIA